MTRPGASPGDDFIAGFLDDYFAECEDHLTVVRRALLTLEDSIGDAGAEAALVDELFRSFHSVKGLSAMVDVRGAERLAHELEGYLRRVRDRELALTSDSLAVLIDSTTTLESVIAARRAGTPAPAVDRDIDSLMLLAAVGRNSRGAVSAGAADGEARPAAAAWRFTFVPSPELVNRGVKVDTIRARLASVGRITSVTPHVTSGGGIAFEFLVTGPGDASVFERWRADGLAWERADPSGAPEAPEGSPETDARTSATRVAEHAILAPSQMVRVDLTRLDDVMRRVADLVVTRARLEENLARIERIIPSPDWRTLQENTLALERQLRDLREDVMRVRLVRVDLIFSRMPFVARDIAREAGKEVRVVLHGQDTEIDKFLVERMMDPLLHLVRNAVSHGIEAPERRLAAGKPAEGVVTLAASTSGEMVVLEISDDGAGIDTVSVGERARAAGTRVPEGPLDSRTLVDLISEPGFSTREEVDRASGRGIGMSIVRTTVQELGGALSVETEAGRGTRFLVSLPLTLAITDALIAVAGGHRFAVPQSSVQEVIEVEESAVRQIENNELVPYRGHSLPLLRLSTLFALRAGTSARLHAFVIGTGQDAVALGVDRILGQREIVVRTMRDALLKIDGISGATELGDGRVVLILDAAALSRHARTAPGRVRSSGPRGLRPAAAAVRSSHGGLA